MKNRPVVKILIPYVAGIILADRLDLSLLRLWILSAAFAVVVIVGYKKRWLSVSSALLVLSFLCVGFLRHEAAMLPPHGFGEVIYQQVTVHGTVVESKEERSGGSSLTVDGMAVSTADPSAVMRGKIFIRSWEEIFPQKYGDVVEVEGKLSRPRLPRNPGLFNYREYLARRGIFSTITVGSASDVQAVGLDGSSFLRWVKGLRQKIETVIEETMPSKSAAVLKGILLGDRAVLPAEMYEAFLRTSTSHILAVSGLHIGLIAGWTFLMFSWIRKLVRLRRKATAYIPVIPVVIIYACMVGFRTSVVRASFLVILAVIAAIIDRDTDIFNLLAVAALGILIYRPCAIWDAGFQLSFGAVASIAYLMPHWERWLSRIRRDKWYRRWLYRAFQSIAVSLSAQIGAMLIIAHTFNRISLIGVIANPLIIPIVALIVPIGFLQSLIGLAFIPLAAAFGFINHILISIMSFIAYYFAGFTYAEIPVRWVSFWHIIAFSAVIVFIANLSILLKEKRRLIMVSAAVVAVLIWSAALSYDGRVLKVTYLDVGQGDSMFVELPDGRNILIDGGPYSRRFDTGKQVVAPFLDHRGINKLDLVVSTHPHNDHAGGLTYTVDSFRVEKVITGSYGLTTPTFDELLKRLNRNGIKYADAQAGVLLKGRGLCVEALGPQELDFSGDEDSRMNNNSVVLKVKYKDASFLFASDIGEESELLLINSGGDLRSTVLKVPHQGSKTSSSWEFLRAIQPTIGVISVGRWNMYRHPSPLILGRYRWLGIKTYRTDRQGAVTVVTDGKRGWIRTMFGSRS